MQGKNNMRKKIFVIFIIGILFFSSFSLSVTTVAADTNDTKEASITVSNPIIKTSEEYITINFDESTSFLMNPGKPMLPIVTKVFTLPFGSKIESVDVSFSQTEELKIPKEIKPAPKPLPVSFVTKTQDSEEFVKDTSLYESSEIFPSSKYSYTYGAGLKDNEHVNYLSVHCYPIRYSPAQNMLYYTKNIDIKVSYKQPLPRVRASNDEYDLVIVAPSEFSGELQRLVDHKNNHGVSTLLKTTEDIYAEYQGRDEAEQIKYFIKDAIENYGTKYVLLVGGIKKLPIRTTWMYHKWHHHYWNQTILSDLYYADVYDGNGDFCSWDSNNNGVYGEIYQNCPGINDTIDLYPDVNVGRLACDNIRQLRTSIGKIIHYETDTYGKNWFNNIILCGGDTFPGRDGYEGEEKNKLTKQIMSDFIPITLWTSDNTFNAQAVNKVVNKGAGFLDYSGHGFEIGLGTHPPNSDSWISYYTTNLLGLRNQYKLPIIFFDACLTARLDFNVSSLIGYLPDNLQAIIKQFNFDGSKLLPCFAWSCVAKPGGGAIATIGATRVAYGSLREGCGYLSLRFYDAYSSSETISQMLTKAQNSYINNLWKDYYTIEEFILLGDPSLNIGGYPPHVGLKAMIPDSLKSNINGYPDTPLQFQASASNGIQPYTYNWDFNNDGMYNDASGKTVEWTWNSPGVYWASVKVTDADGHEDTYDTLVYIDPKANKPSGPTIGKPGIEYTFTAQAIDDSSLNQMYTYYYFDWGDGTFSDVLGPYPAGVAAKATHTWSNPGTYKVRVKTSTINFKNFNFEETGWSDPLSINIPKNRQVSSSFSQILDNIMDKFSLLVRLLQMLYN